MDNKLPDLQVAWVDACAKFKEATGFDLAASPESKSVNGLDIVNKFNAKKAKNDEAKQKIDRAKTAIGNTIKAVQRVGTIAAQGVSMVFGSPATITMSCISFLVDAGFEYKNIAHNIEDLFSQIATIMERFQIYRDHEQIMAPPMIRVAHRLLLAVVSVCRLCIESMNRNPVKKFFSIALFSSDGGIRAQLGFLKSLEAEELQMKGTLTLVATETNKRDTAKGFEEIKAAEAKIASSVSQLSASSTDQKVLNELNDKLGVDDAASKAEHRACQDKLVSGSCSWLRSDTQYLSWSDAANQQESLLVLGGDEGYGKSFTQAAIIRDLMMRYPQGRHDTSRVSVAYYYLTRVSKRDTHSSKTGPSIKDALRSWAWQILNNDLFYRKDMTAMFKQSSDLGDLKETWQKLFLNHADKDASFFLLLDGTHELEATELNDLVTLLKALSSVGANAYRLKIMITSRAQFVQRLIQTPLATSTMDLRDKTHIDMEKHIQEKASTLAIFQKETPQVRDLKAQVCSGLLEAVNGNFLLADTKLREISSKYDAEEVLQIVERTKEGANMNDSIREDIHQANRTLNAREMGNLNTLLLWVMYAEWWLQNYELESILFVQQGRSSLQPLYNEIRDKFSAFFELNGEADWQFFSVNLKHDSIKEYFENLSEERHSAETTATKTLTKGEIFMVKHFVEKLCEQDIYERLGFGDFFDQKLSQSDTGVTVDCENAHATIALGCLRALTEIFSDEAEGLAFYARYQLASHLKQIDLDSVDPRLKAELGPRLVKLFRDTPAIQKSNESAWLPWSYNDDGVREVLRLFRSSAVMKKVTGSEAKDQEWVHAILDHAAPEIALLEDAVRVKGNLWLTSESSDDVLKHFLWLYGYHNKVESTSGSDVERVEEVPSKEQIEVEDIQGVLQMVQGLQISELSKPMSLRNVGVTYRDCGHITVAIHSLDQALAIDTDYLLARVGLALAYAQETSQGPGADWKAALYHNDIAIERVKTGVRIFSDVEPEAQLEFLLMDKALWLGKIGQYEESRKIYKDLLQKAPENDELRLECIYTFYDAQYYTDVVEMLQALGEEVDQETQKTRLSRFFHAHVSDHKYHSTVFRAFKQVGHMLEIKGHYQRAMEDASKEKNKQNSTTTYYDLTYYYAVMLYNHGNTATEKEEAIKLWERIITLTKSDHNMSETRILSARRLAKVYIAKAVEAGRGSALATELLSKLQIFTTGLNGENSDDDDDWGVGLSRAHVRSLLGRYHSAAGEIEKAREQLRPDIEVGIKLLSDDDPENDYQGYLKLSDALMYFGDDANAIAAWCMIQPTEGLPPLNTTSDSKSSPRAEPEIADADMSLLAANGSTVGPKSDTSLGQTKNGSEELSSFQPPPLKRSNTSFLARKLTGPLGNQCDGRCGRAWTYADDIYVCRECIDVQFDERCLVKLRQGEIGRDICDRDHKFMHVPAWDLASAERAHQGKVLVGDQVLEVNAWLEGIKREWGLLDTDHDEVKPSVDAAV